MTHSTNYYHDSSQEITTAVNRLRVSDSESPVSDEDQQTLSRPSAKALGKRRAAVPDDSDCKTISPT